jgi:hypothetical protein
MRVFHLLREELKSPKEQNQSGHCGNMLSRVALDDANLPHSSATASARYLPQPLELYPVVQVRNCPILYWEPGKILLSTMSNPPFGQQEEPASNGVPPPKLPMGRPETPHLAASEQKLVPCVVSGWMKFAMLVLAIAVFIIAMFLFR